jgi:mono/diheme cytochrome c family protein
MKHCVILLIILLAAGCNEGQDEQNRFNTYAPANPPWPRGSSALPLPEGVIAQGDTARAREMTNPPAVTRALIERGQQRFGIYCAPCHGLDGAADGIIVARGFPQPPSFHSPELRAAPGQLFFDTITNGYGAMYSYADRVDPADRWAVVAYIRALQLSQLHAQIARHE